MFYTTPLLALLATTATSLPHNSLRPRSNCNYHPNQTQPIEQSTPAYFLHLESLSTNETLGYLDAFTSPYALLSQSRESASQAFNAPDWNTNIAMIFWNGEQTEERGLNLDVASLGSPESIAEVTTGGCGTRTEDLAPKYEGRGTCGMAGQKVTAKTGCPPWGTTNDAGGPCVPQRFFLCDSTGLDGVDDAQQVVYFGVAATAQYGPNCKEVDLVSECP